MQTEKDAAKLMPTAKAAEETFGYNKEIAIEGIIANVILENIFSLFAEGRCGVTCDAAGEISPMGGIIASFQSIGTIKYLTGELLTID